MNRLRVAASLWSVSRGAVVDEAHRLARAGVPRLHWDSADGTVGRAGGFAPAEAARISADTGAAGEAHLMTTEPLLALDAWLTCCDTVAIHRDARDWRAALQRITDAGRTPAVAIATVADLADLDPSIGVLVMSVRPGDAGSGFDHTAFDRVREARRRGHRLVGVDGSVTAALGSGLVAAGANWLVSGTSITSDPDPAAWMRLAAAA